MPQKVQVRVTPTSTPGALSGGSEPGGRSPHDWAGHSNPGGEGDELSGLHKLWGSCPQEQGGVLTCDISEVIEERGAASPSADTMSDRVKVMHDYTALVRWLRGEGTGDGGTPPRATADEVTWDELKRAFFYFSHVSNEEKDPEQQDEIKARSKSLQNCRNRDRILSVTRGGYERQLQRTSSILEHVIHTYDTLPPRSKSQIGPLMTEEDWDLMATMDEETPLKYSIRRSSFRDPKVEVKIPQEDEEDVDDKEGLLWRRVFGGACLLIGLISMSCIGSVASEFAFPSDGGHPVNGMLLGCWIAQSLHIIFVIVSLLQYLGSSREERARLRWLLTGRGFLVTLIAGTFSGIGSGCWTLSFGLTSVPQSYLFNAFPPTVIMIVRCIAGLPTFWDERLGVVVGVIGAVLVLMGSAGGSNGPDPVLGDCLAFMSSVSNAVCVLSGKFAAGEVPTTAYLAGVTLGSALVQLIFCLFILDDSSHLLSTHETLGMFGWLAERWRFLFPCLAAAFTVGQWCMFAALTVVPALGVSMVLTAQPIVATIMGVAVLQTEDHWPAPLAIFGGLLIVAGSLFVVYSSSSHEMEAPDEEELVEMVDASPRDTPR
eukprot:Hpha_TRINITY_DN30190_c0_g1::TRINITY_DN30190_c0_g1_i1::g.110601::m.110601